MAVLHDHGGQLRDGGRPAAHARGGRPLPPLARSGRLAGAADRHHQPLRADAALRLVSPAGLAPPPAPLEEFHGGGGVGRGEGRGSAGARGDGGCDSGRVEPGDGLYSDTVQL